MNSPFQRPFTIHATALSLAMTTVHVDQPITCEPAKPEVKGEGRLVKVVGKPIRGFQQDVLDNVAGIDTASDAAVHPGPDQPAKCVTVTIQQPGNRVLVTTAGGGQEFASPIRIGPQQRGSFRGIGCHFEPGICRLGKPPQHCSRTPGREQKNRSPGHEMATGLCSPGLPHW